MAESLAPPLNEAAGRQGRRRYHPSIRCRDLGSLSKQIRLLERFHQRCLRSIRGIKWQDYVSNEEVLKRANLPSIESILLQVQLRLAGHVSRTEDARMPKPVFFSELQNGNRDCWAPRKRYKDQLKRQLAQAGISHQSWQQVASDRDSWRSSVKKAIRKFEVEKHEAAKERHRRQKERVTSQSSSVQTFACPKCSRVCGSRIRLYSHQRSCNNWPSSFPKSSSARNQPSDSGKLTKDIFPLAHILSTGIQHNLLIIPIVMFVLVMFVLNPKT